MRGCGRSGTNWNGLFDQRWIAFTFDYPEHLPPAVEANSIAWRYEVEVSRPTRFSMQERAVATPIGFELV